MSRFASAHIWTTIIQVYTPTEEADEFYDVLHIDHVCISRQWRSALQDVRVFRVADVGSDHHISLYKSKTQTAMT